MTQSATPDLDELLLLLESQGAGFALFELTDDAAVVAPEIEGVGAFLPLSGTVHISADGMVGARVPMGSVALTPAAGRIHLSTRANPTHVFDSRDRLRRRGPWMVVPATGSGRIVARVAAARIIGSGVAGLNEMLVSNLMGCGIAEPLIRQLAAEVNRAEEGHAGFAMALMNACVVHAIRRIRAETPMASSRTSRGGVTRAIAAVRSSPGDNHTIDGLAEIAGMSRSSLLRWFMRATGETPQRFVQQARLEEAAALLRSTDLPIKAIAARSGFLSRSHFSRAFREVYATDPTAFRKDAASAVPESLE